MFSTTGRVRRIDAGRRRTSPGGGPSGSEPAAGQLASVDLGLLRVALLIDVLLWALLIVGAMRVWSWRFP